MEKGKQVPNWSIQPIDGEAVSLWSFRQRSHVVVMLNPNLNPEDVKRWQAQIAANQKQWDWLNARFFFSKVLPEGVEPGVYVIDRYARLWNVHPLETWSLADQEQELVYYEARHC
jgi:hypothetical protein